VYCYARAGKAVTIRVRTRWETLAPHRRATGSSGRCDKNRKYRTAWEALDRDACFAQATEGYPGAESLYDAVRKLLDRRIAIMEMDHDSVPPNALGRPAP
jgi:hypothetical protein